MVVGGVEDAAGTVAKLTHVGRAVHVEGALESAAPKDAVGELCH